MAIRLLVRKALVAGFPATRAWQIVLTDDDAFFLHLGKDWRGFGIRSGGGLEGLAAGAILSVKAKKSDRIIAERLEDIDYAYLEDSVASDRRSVRVSFADIRSVRTKPKSVMAGEASFFIRTSKKSYNFRVFSEEEREALVNFFQDVRPDLFDGK